MGTIFGPDWQDLRLADVQAHLAAADGEPLPWEAKGTKLSAKEVRRQVCAFANSHDGGYLILGARKNPDGQAAQRWLVEGVAFPTEPMTWITNVIADPDGGVRPRPRFDVHAWPLREGHVAVVWIPPVSTPPCIANGSLYERLPGESRELKDPLVLADFYRRGDDARRGAEDRADRAALTVLEDQLGAEAGVFRTQWTPPPEYEPDKVGDQTYTRFAVGVAATGNPPNISGRLFKADFVDEVWTLLRERPMGLPANFGSSPDPVTWSQDALTCRHQIIGPMNGITVVRAAWDGSVAVGQKLVSDSTYVDSLAESRIAPDWRLADKLVARLGGFGDVYVTVLVAGGQFPRRKATGHIVLQRGPVLPGVDDEHVASLSRELMRTVGNLAPEP